jgi:hypothetical protein
MRQQGTGTRGSSRPLLLGAVSVLLCLWFPAGAAAAQSAHITAKFHPERLGEATTVSLGFQIAASGTAPVALTGMSLAYPANLGFATSGLGLAACSPGELEVIGIKICPPNSKIGSGRATVEIPIGPAVVREDVTLTLFAGPSSDGYLHVLTYASGVYPVEAQVVMSGVLRSGRLAITVPPIPSLPAAPDVALVQMQLTLGGDLTYYEPMDGRSVPYRPAGVGLPTRCPHGGFPFAATFAFVDGGSSSARTAVPCPHRREPRGRPHAGRAVKS